MLFAVVAVPLILVALEATDTTNLFGEKDSDAATVSTGQQTKGEIQDETTSDEESEPGSSDGTDVQKSSNSGQANSGNLLSPENSQFVSAHNITLSDNPTLQSTCVTSPGASCVISFTSGTKTKSLNAQTTDREGATYWDWKPNELGLSKGKWTITATATLNGQSKSAKDAIQLEVL